jgi:cytochrome b561
MSDSGFAVSELDLSRDRYSRVAKTLHWIIALAVVLQIALGWYMATIDDRAIHQMLEGRHISIGITILLLTLARIGWALTHPRPPLPEGMAGWEKGLARATHTLFYVLLLALPLSGWVMESTGPRPIPFWGLTWPHFPFLDLLLAGRDHRAFHETVESIHGSPLVWSMIALIVLHVAGALKHQFDGHPILWRMVPGMRRR